jgi:mannose-1-phosphate guanylyltransferase
MYVVVMAGGGGTRLWPLSTPERPKPFLPLLGEETLLQRTIARLRPIVPSSDVHVLVSEQYATLVRQQLPDVRVVVEPFGRNTAAAIGLATVAVDRPDDEVMVVLPADHTIEREDVFAGVLRAAAEHLATGALGVTDPLVTLGIRMDRPATEYGYLRPRREAVEEVGGLRAYRLRAFIEKPDAEHARGLFEEGGGIAWNAGMFLWRRRAVHAALHDYAPDILADIESGVGAGDLTAAYERVRPTSIDYAVMEAAAADGRVIMGAMDVGWSDLGSWTQLLEAIGIRGAEGRVVQAGASDAAGDDDLVVRRVDGQLVLDSGPRDGILDASGPSAILAQGRAHRAVVEALLARCSQQESRP